MKFLLGPCRVCRRYVWADQWVDDVRPCHPDCATQSDGAEEQK